jgi:tetratricopeptide (TPR) repeat protein
MAKIYVSSTRADLEEERKAVIDWLIAAGHQPVHSYRPNSETVRNGCLEDIDQCEMYVLIAGHRYGFQPDDDNPEGLSITHLEFRRADRIPRVALLRKNIPDEDLSDLADPDRLRRVQEFRKEVGKAVTPAEFRDKAGLIQGLSTGIQAELEKLKPSNQKIVELLLKDNHAKDVRIQELEAQLAAAVARTAKAAEAPGATLAELAAFDALKVGDTAPAAALLREKEGKEAEASGDGEQARKLAELAREQGALAMGRDVRAALASFQRAAEYDPADVRTHFLVGDVQSLLGNLREALNSYHRGAAEAENAWNRNSQDATAQRDLSASYDRIGNMRVLQGELSAALAAYEKGLAIRKALVQRNSANTEWQRDLSVSCEKIGDVRVSQGERAAAVAAYENGLMIARALAERDPANTQWQVDLTVFYSKLAQAELDLSVAVRRDYLQRGRSILVDLKEQGRLAANQDAIAWFEERLESLPPEATA